MVSARQIASMVETGTGPKVIIESQGLAQVTDTGAIEAECSRLSGRLGDEPFVDPADLDVLEYERFMQRLEAGVASHHAGMVPAFKEAVEACFVEGLVKVVFATETLALGINMPARAVVIERLTKFNGDSHEHRVEFGCCWNRCQPQ